MTVEEIKRDRLANIVAVKTGKPVSISDGSFHHIEYEN